MTTPLLFDDAQLARQRHRAAAGFASVAFLMERMASDLADRIAATRRTFRVALNLGGEDGYLAAALEAVGVDQMTTLIPTTPEALPASESTFDLIVSAGALHWVNDLPGMMGRIRHCLKPDGLFLAIFPGERTLHELRTALAEAEAEVLGGIRPHVIPMVDLHSAAGLLQQAGFALPVADVEHLTLSYPHPLALLHELRQMGEGNALITRPHYLRRDVLRRACERYMDAHTDAEGRINATVDLISLTGWKPDASQPQPARRGSGTISLRSYLSE